ncbi:MAG: beta-ketoacyl-ACP synthase 3 [Nanoarchaeota archaeon]|nr:beta-ketoacyl-ACP synthase 3 [DPANN group archaeon]MBL7116462.1 beta-ketoacyl-ACP synthase 3 [Nanoarchaeota archaeon]
MGIVIYGPGVHIPPDVITNANIKKLVETSDEWIRKRTGMKERRISLDKDVREMGALAAKGLLDKIDCNPGDIDEVIFAMNMHHENITFPAHAGYVAAAIGANKDAIIHDKFAGCTGLVYAIREAYNNILSGDVDRVLVIGAERLTDMTDYSDRSTCILFGDGAGAYLVKRSEQEGIIKNVLGGEPDTGGENWSDGYLTLQYKEGVKIVSKENGAFQTERKKQNYLVMHGRKVFAFATKVMKRAVCDVIKDTPYSLDDIDVLLPHGANMRIIKFAKKTLEKEGFKGIVFTNLEWYGNTSTASTPIAAAEAIEKGIIKEGSLVVNVAFGAGFTYGANLYRARVNNS